MSGRQINFYLLPSEQVWFDEILKTSGQVRVLSRMESQFRPQFAPSTVIQEFGRDDLKVHLILDTHLDQICAIVGAQPRYMGSGRPPFTRH